MSNKQFKQEVQVLRRDKIKNMVDKYGHEILDDFETLRTLPYSTLEAMGEKYGVTRERVRQQYKIVYAKPYTQALREKRAFARNEKETSCNHDPRHKVCEYVPDGPVYTGAIYEKEFLEQCESKGFCVRPILKRVVDLRVNGYLVDVKYCSAPMQTSPDGPPYYRYVVSKNQARMCDFFACYHPGQEAFFIIPNKTLPPKSGIIVIYIPEESTNSENKYWEYKNAWHLLELS